MGCRAQNQCPVREPSEEYPLPRGAPTVNIPFARGNRMHAMCTPYGCGRCLRQAEVLHFPRFHQLRHRSDGIFDWRFGIYSMLIIQVDAVDAEAFERGVTGGSDVVGLTTDSKKTRIVFLSKDPKL